MNALAVTVMEFTVPTIEYRLLAPVLVVFGAAVIGILVEAFVPRHLRNEAQLGLVFAALIAGIAVAVRNWAGGAGKVAAMGSLVVDGPVHFMWTMLMVFGLLAGLLFAETKVGGGVSQFVASGASVPGSQLEADASAARREHTEVFPLLLFALAGMMLFPASNDLITMFVALEVFSLPLYLLSGLARRRRLLSQEAALKYFMLGAFSSAFFLFGTALLYGYSGSFRLSDIAEAIAVPQQGQGLLVTGMALLALGLLFKVGAVPFHSWTPDVYMGAPTAVTGFMAICTKIAAVGALLRVFYVALGAIRWDWQPAMAIIAVLTMAVGSVIAIAQTDVKRMLAYSSIAHAGFILAAFTGAVAGTDTFRVTGLDSVSSVLFYLAAYGFATLGAFAIVTMVRKAGGENNAIAGWQGLARRSPALAIIFTLFLMSFAGIPLTAGFMGKWAVFAAAWRGGYWWLVVVAVVMSLIAAFFYLRMVVVMFADDEAEGLEVGRASWMTWSVIGIATLATVVLGIFPGPLLDLAQQASGFLR